MLEECETSKNNKRGFRVFTFFCNSDQSPMGTTFTLQSKSFPKSKLSTEKKRKMSLNSKLAKKTKKEYHIQLGLLI